MEPRPGQQGSPRGGSRRKWSRLISNTFLVAGAVCLFLAGFAYLTDPSRADMSLPRPVALADGADEALSSPTLTPSTSTPEPGGSVATAAPTILPTPTPTPAPVKIGVPVRVEIPSVGVDSKVQDIGTAWVDGQLIWETIPFIVGHYRSTAQAGQNGNAVFAGHVTSRNWGNVFIDLYKIKLGDEVLIYSDDTVFTYVVTRVRLVLPTETGVMDATPGPTATLITCGGDWIPEKHEYSHRLIVTAKLTAVKPIS